MIERKQLQKLADRQQTTLENVVREYFQHLFLSLFYQEKESEKVLFKGGTALRIIWQSPRFSEDLDFTGVKIFVPEIESLMEAALIKMAREDVKAEIMESKKTSGGYLAIFGFQVEDYKSRIQVEVSLRKNNKGKGSVSLIQSDLTPPYTLVHLEENRLIGEKIQACLTRGKARDYYDLYFILRGRMAFQEMFKEKGIKEKILLRLRQESKNFKQELKQFLPVNQHIIIKNFPAILMTEIERSLPGKNKANYYV